ncbi:MAG: MEDS domain-containing protein [Kineosporiaceae bacterium]
MIPTLASPTGRTPFVSSARGRVPGDHVCWAFRGPGDLGAAARDFVSEGLALGERVAYVGQGSQALLAQALDDVVGLDHHLRRGHVIVASVVRADGTDSSDRVDEVAALAEMSGIARAEGYTGLRVLTDVTPRVTGPLRRAGYLALEHRLDRLCRTGAVTAMCAYDVERLGAAAVAELAAAHSSARAGTTPFVVRAATAADLSLAGQVDAFSAEALERTLRRLNLPVQGASVSVDVAELDLVDHHGLLALDRWAEYLGVTVVLRGARPLHAFLVDELGLDRVRPDLDPAA